jgi:predicted ABC-type ATPase
MPKRKKTPRCIVIAGPNGAGKTTVARRAGRLVLQQLDQLAAKRVDFAFETTFSGLGYVRRIRAWKRAGYKIEIVYLKLQSTRLALRRIAARVREGGHNVPRSDVIRRFSRGWKNFKRVYQTLADVWTVYDNSGREPRLLEKSE